MSRDVSGELRIEVEKINLYGQTIFGNVSKSYETIGISIRLQTTLQSRQDVPLCQTLSGYYFQEEDSRMRAFEEEKVRSACGNFRQQSEDSASSSASDWELSSVFVSSIAKSFSADPRRVRSWSASIGGKPVSASSI